MRRLFRLIAGLAVLCLLAGGLTFGALWLAGRPGPLPEARAIVVPHGGLVQVAHALQDARALPPGGLARQGFRLAARLTRERGAIHAAELRFPAHASVREILDVLRTAPPVQHALTIPEGVTAFQVMAMLREAAPLSGGVPVLAEGSVLPQTYDYVRGSSRAALAARMQLAMRRTLASVWAERDPESGLGSPSSLLTLASLVERETAVPSERPEVARVFLNRLRLGMRLQSDPTVIYVVSSRQGLLGRPLSRTDLATPSPYNTYETAGLPPGPICSPGLASLQAAAHPANGDALYFVADGSGGHVFAADLATHSRNVARLRAREAPTPATAPPTATSPAAAPVPQP